jgi:hypothetical protein
VVGYALIWFLAVFSGIGSFDQSSPKRYDLAGRMNKMDRMGRVKRAERPRRGWNQYYGLT